MHNGTQDEDVYTYFDPEPPFERYPHHGCNGKTERALDRRLAAKSCDRLLAKSNKGGVVRTKSFPLASPEQGGSHVQTNSLKDRRYTEQDTMELELSPIMNITVDTYFSCAVGQKHSAARYSIPTSDEVVVFLNLLANTYSEPVQNGDKSPYLGLGTSNLASVQNYPELG
jgi:hypothetical protein